MGTVWISGYEELKIDIIWKGGGFYRPLFYCIENFFDIIYVSKMVEIPVLNNETGCEIILLVL